MPEQKSEPEQEGRWTSRSIGSRFQHSIFYFLIRYSGRKIPYVVLGCVALYYTLFKPAVRKKAEYYLTHRFSTDTHPKRLLHCYRLYTNLGRALIDRASIGIRGLEYVSILSTCNDDLLRLVNEGRGLIMLSAHVGCWQAAMAQLRWPNTPVSLLLHREEGDVDRHYFEHSRTNVPFRIIDPMGYMGGILEMIEVLKRGEVLSMMGDRVFGSESKVVPVDFLGEKARFPFSAFKLSSATGAPVAVLFSHCSGPGKYEMSLEGVIRVPSGLGRSEKMFYPYVARFAGLLESYTDKFPYQFFNFYDMWEETRTYGEMNRPPGR